MQENNTAVHARHVLHGALQFLMCLEKSYKNEYIRCMCVASLLWSKQAETLPACAFVEEALESSLSRLASIAGTDLRTHTVQQFSDMYAALGPAPQEPHNVNKPEFSRTFPHRVLLRLRRLAAAITAGNMPFVLPTGTVDKYRTKGTRAWPEKKLTFHLPKDPSAPVDVSYAAEAFRHSLVVLVTERGVFPDEERKLQELCGRVRELNDGEVLRRKACYEALLGREVKTRLAGALSKG